MSWRNDWPARVKAPNPAIVVSAAPNSPRDSDTPHGQQLCEMELEPNAEHQENDSHLGELFRQRLIGYEARRVGTNDNPAHEIPDNGRQPEPVRQVSEHQGGRQTTGEGQDEIKVMHRVCLRRYGNRSYLFAILDQLAIERLTVDLQEVGRLGFLPLSPLQSEQDIFAFEVRQCTTAHQGGL
jgi:hypothetical protein